MMLLISSTRRLFKRTVESLKKVVSGGGGSYQRLPKTPPLSPSDPDRRRVKAGEGQEKQAMGLRKSSFGRVKAAHGERPATEETRGARICLVAKRLEELQLVDKANVDHLLDIQEVFHCYSRLTCPAYLDIVDAFFTDLFDPTYNTEHQLFLDT